MARQYPLEKFRNFGIMAHIDLVKQLLLSVFFSIQEETTK